MELLYAPDAQDNRSAAANQSKIRRGWNTMLHRKHCEWQTCCLGRLDYGDVPPLQVHATRITTDGPVAGLSSPLRLTRFRPAYLAS